MKRNYSIVVGILLLLSIPSFAADRFWVGGTGEWSDGMHWSSTSGGIGGSSIPTLSDNVIFDEYASDNTEIFLNITGTAQCHDLTFSENLGTVKIIGSSPSSIKVSGSLSFSNYVKNLFSGEISFVGIGSKTIDFKNAMPSGNVRFNGNSIWTLNSNLFLPISSSIYFTQGQLNAQTRSLLAFGISWSGTESKILNISNSKLVLVQSLDQSGIYNSSVITDHTIIRQSYVGVTRSIDSIHTVIVAPTCNTSTNGSITVTVFSPDAGPFQYDWTGPGCPCSGSPLGGLGAGSYLLTVTDLSDGESISTFVTVTAPNPIGCNFVKRKPKCNGQCNGSIAATVIAGSGTAPYTYSWNTIPVQTTPTATNLCAGTYILTITDFHGCTQSFTQVLTQPTVVNPNATFTNLLCAGVCNGTASTAASGGNTPTPYTYSWAPGGLTTSSISALCAGSYTVTVKDDSLCVGTATVTITSPPALVTTPSSTNITCFGLCNGSATVAPVSGGVAPYTYTWVPAAGSVPTLSSLCPGVYSVTVTDANSCTSNSSFTITQPASLTVSATSTNVTCFGACDGTAHAIPVGGTAPYTYVWTGSTAGPYTGAGTSTLTNLCPGTYTITITDAHGCTATANTAITQPALLVANPVGTNILCFGACNGTITATPTGGTPAYTYVWTGPGALTGQGTPTLTGLCIGTYNVTVTDSHGCTSTQSVTITQPPLLTVTIAKTNVTCFGACNGTTTATPAGGSPGYTYVWTGSTAGPYAGAGTANLTGLCPGTYTVTITDINGCTATANTTITQPPIFTVSVTNTLLSCNGDCNATAAGTVVGGTPGYTFNWSPGAPLGDGTSNVNSLCAGTYTLDVTDLNGCIASDTITITQPTALVLVTNVVNVTCFGASTGSAQAIAGGGTPGYTYSWSPGGQTTSSIVGQAAGSYTVCVTDANGCSKCDTLVIAQPNLLLANPTIVNNVTCSGLCDGSATSVPTGGTVPYTYNWSPGAPLGDLTSTITSLCPGVYSVTVTDSNACTSTQSVTITQPSPLSASIASTTSSCNICNGSATVSVVGGTGPYTYLWSPGGQTTPTATLLCANVTYTVDVTDANGCTASVTVTISQVVVITITTSGTTLSCNGSCNGTATANPVGGVAPYVYLWAPTGQTTQTANALCSGTYTVTVTDFNGCLNTDSITFTDPPLLDVTAVHTNESCGGACDGTATATATGGTGAYTYSWLPGGQTTATATNLCQGTYTLTVTDANGCTDTVSVIISGQPVVTDNFTIVNATCLLADGSISVAPTGGTPGYTYVWGPGAPTGQGTTTITNLLPGAYTLVITDIAGCSFNFNYLLNNVAGPNLVMSHTDVSCHNVCDGTATVVASAGAGGYTYDWTPGAPAGDLTPAITALCGTVTYTVTVTDAAGCITLDTARVINPTLISPNPTVVNESCGGVCDGIISLAPTGGNPGYTYLWAPGGQTTSSISGLCAGSYVVTVTDSKGCDSVLTITITSPPLLTVTLASTNVLCNGACNGTATATPVGGSGAYTYTWSNGPFVVNNIVNLCPGSYYVIVGDGSACTASDTVIITEPALLTTSTTQTNATCSGVCDGTAQVISAGGTIPYSYVWSPLVTTNAAGDNASALCAGTYNVTLTDANGCTSAPPAIVITQPTVIVPNVTFVNPLCNSACNGTATASPTGGSGTYTYLWSNGQITQTAINLCAGSYTCTVSNSSGAGCAVTQIIVLVDPTVLSANPSSVSPTCFNACNGTVISSPVGGTPGYTYSWSPGGAITQTVNSLCPNTYQVIVTDANGCKDTATTVMVNPAQINAVIGSTTAACGVCDGTMTITPTTGTAPYTYVWSPAPGAGQFTPNGTLMCAGLYTITVTDFNGCDSVFTAPMNNSGGPTSLLTSETDVSCFGTCNGTATLDSVIGGLAPYTYLWNDGPPATTIDTAVSLCAGTYFISVTDANSCFFASPVVVNSPAPILSNGVITSAVCSNICTGTISLAPSGGTPGYTYFWTPVGSIAAGQGTANVSGLCPGTYYVNITDANLCVKVDSFVVTQSAPLNATISAVNISCASLCNGMAYVTITTGTPPYTIQWNDPMGQANDTASSLCAGNYSVDITDALGCTLTLNTTITSAPAMVANPTIVDATCGLCDGTAVVAPTGGTAPYTYVWSNGPTTANTSGLCSGLYTVNITDNAGCLVNFAIPVSNTGGPTSVAITSTNITCHGTCNGAVTATTPSGGLAPYTFLWIAGGQTTSTLAGLCAGTYYVQVTDANGCSLMDSVTITEPAAIASNQVVTAATCGASDGAITVTPSGGTGPYTILWNTGSGLFSLINLSPGVYTATITDAVGCTSNIVVTVNSAGGPTVTVVSTNVSCNALCDGTAIATAIGSAAPYSYLWNDASATTTPNANSLCAGNYVVQVTGSDGCISVAPVTITQPTPISFSVASAINPPCNGDTTGSITVIPSGGTLSYTYSWNTVPSQTTLTASNLTANTYIATVTDANGCSATQTVTLVEPPALTISAVITNSSCNTISDGSIDITVGGGTPVYNYLWSNAAVTQDLIGVLSGTYTVTVTDAKGCTIADTSTILPNATVIAVAGNDTSFCESGAITLSAAGSTNGVNYQWFQITGAGNVSVGNTITVSVTPPNGITSYYVVVDNGTGCSDNDTVNVTSSPLPVANAGADFTIVTGGSTTIGGSPTGPVGSTYNWSYGTGLNDSTIANPLASPTTTTTYTVIVTNAQGCSAQDSILITVLPTIVIPNGISPNADGANDEWIIDGIQLFPNCTVEVYNRWGELLFQSVGYKEHWKGTFKGKDLPVGTYYYIINLKDPLYPDAYTGPITIMR